MNDNLDLIIALQRVKQYNQFSDFPASGNINKLYVDRANNVVYRWNGTAYVQVSSSATQPLNFLGTYNAQTNSPALSSGSGTTGDFYVTSVANDNISPPIDGIAGLNIDDQILAQPKVGGGTEWVRIPATSIDNTPIELTGSQMLTQLDTVYLINATVADAIITIPDADATNGGKEIQIIKNSGDFNVLVSTTTPQFIGNLTAQTISQTGKGFTAISRGSDNSWAITQDSRTSLSIKTVNSIYEITADDNTVLANGTFTITLPTDLYAGFLVSIKNIGTGTITLTSTSNIDDTTSKVINVQYDSYVLQWDGTQWWIL